MITCSICKLQSEPGEKVVHLVLATRPTIYPPRPKSQRVVIEGKIEWRDDPGGKGHEIVREVLVHKHCITP